MAEPGRERKRRKWDVANPQGVPVSGHASPAAAPALPAGLPPAAKVPGASPTTTATANRGPPSADAVAKAKLEAMSVLEKINQDLRAKGNVPLRVGPDEDRIKREVTINDAPPPIRFNLTKRSTQDDIARRTGTQVVVRGRYLPPGTPPSGDEPPLFLKVTPGLVASEPDHVQEEAVEKAAAEIRYLLQGGVPGAFRPGPARFQSPASQQPPFPGSAPRPVNQPGAFHGGPQHAPSPAAAPYAAVSPGGPKPAPVPLYIGTEAPPDFGLAGKLRGPGDSFLSHIAQTTGTSVVLRGRGGGMVETPEPLHILISGGDQKGIDEATRLAKNLIDTVRQEVTRAYPYGVPAAPYAAAPMQPPGYGPVPPVAAYQPPYPYPAPAPSYPGQQPPGYQGGYFAPQQSQTPPSHPAYSAAQYPPAYYPPPAGQTPPYYPPHSGAAQPVSAAPQGGSAVPPQKQQPPAVAQGQPPDEQHAPPGSPGAAEAQERKRRFKEVKDTPPPVPEKPAPYAPRPMGPPPPRKPGMGPPPPRPPRADQQGGSGISNTESSISGSLEGLVDY